MNGNSTGIREAKVGKTQQKENSQGPLIRWLDGRRGLTDEGYQAILDIVDTKTAAWYDEIADSLQCNLERFGLVGHHLDTVWLVDRWYHRCIEGYSKDLIRVRAVRAVRKVPWSRDTTVVSMTQWLAIGLCENDPGYDVALWLAGMFEQVVRERVNAEST